MSSCVSISEQNLSKAVSIAGKFDIAEVRLDLCDFSTDQIQKLFSSHNNLIATYRFKNGKINIKLEALKTAMESGAAFVDIEHDLDITYRNQLINCAKENNTKIIFSYHNFTSTEDEEFLHAIIDQGNKLGAIYVKIASKANNKKDALRINQLYKNHSNIIAFSLGDDYKFTRIYSVFLGAPFTYVYYGYRKNQLTEGQLSSKEYEDIMKSLSPLMIS